ncbi:MAG: cytochrome c [Pseudomonadota bacterium]
MRNSLALPFLIFLAACNSGDGASSGAAAAPTAAAPAEAAAAPEVDPAIQAWVDTRRSALKLIRHNFVPILLMVRGEIPFDAQVAATNSTRLHHLSMMLGDTFTKDTRGSGAETESLDRIWEDAGPVCGKDRRVCIRR